MDAQRTRTVINRLLSENNPSEPRPTAKPPKQLKSFKEVTGGLSKKTNVIISPKNKDAENNVNVKIDELSQQALRGYVKKASKDISQRKDDYVKDILSVREPKFKDVFRKIGNRAVGIQKALRRTDELSQATLRGYVKGSSKDLNREIETNKIKDTGGSKVTKRMKNRQKGLFQAAERLVGMAKESAPTNSMGLSSSAHGTGNIDTFDPLLGKKRKRKPTTRLEP